MARIGYWFVLGLLVVTGCDQAAPEPSTLDVQAHNATKLGELTRADVAYTTGQVSPLQAEGQLYGYLESADLVYWQTSWEDDAAGCMVQLGSSPGEERESGVHAGKLGVQFSGKPVLVLGELSTHASAPLTVDGESQAAKEAPITLRRLDAQAGNLTLRLADAVEGLARWDRNLFWEAQSGVRVIDELDFELGVRGELVFRWPLATSEQPTITQEDKRTVVEWSDAAMVIQTDSPVTITPVTHGAYTVLEVETTKRPASLKMLTRILPSKKD
ncbi:MAG: hypothetical protein AAGF10_06940 [Verrucomicrobiota bacterium]